MENIFKQADVLKNNLHKAKIKDFNYNPFLEAKVTLEDLNNIKINHLDINVAKDLSNNSNRIVYFIRNDECCPEELEIVPYLQNISNTIKYYTRYEASHRGFYLYPPNSYCGWHTNSGYIGERFYLSWCKEGNKSFFRYQDPKTKEIHTKWEKAGWNINRFKISNKEDELLWHCVYSDTIRISIGFNLEYSSCTFIHIGRCSGSSIMDEIKTPNGYNTIPYTHINEVHMREPFYSKYENYVIIIRNPIDRFVSAFNWSYYRLETPSYNVNAYDNYVKNNPDIDKFNYYKNANFIGENIYDENGELNLEIHEFINQKGRTEQRKYTICQLGFGIDKYLGNFLNFLENDILDLSFCAIPKIISYHSLKNDCKDIFNINLESHLKETSNTKYNKNLSEKACENFEKYFQKDFNCIERLYKLNALTDIQYNSLMFNHKKLLI